MHILIPIEEKDEHSVPAWVEPAVIFAILILNAIVGIYQDYNAEKALDALKELQSIDALVLRDGVWLLVKSKDVVPGDIIQVKFSLRFSTAFLFLFC